MPYPRARRRGGAMTGNDNFLIIFILVTPERTAQSASMTGKENIIFLILVTLTRTAQSAYCERQQSSDVYKGVHERERSRSQCRYTPSQT